MIALERDITDKNGRKLISCGGGTELGTWGMHKKIELEAPVYLGSAQIDVSKIGAFTYIELRKVRHATNHCIIECEEIGRFCMIASRVTIGLPNHPTNFLSSHTLFRYDNRCDFFHDFLDERNDEMETKV